MLLDKQRTLKIADFGVARVEASNPHDMTGETGTLGYMAPEVGKFFYASFGHFQLNCFKKKKMMTLASRTRFFLGTTRTI